MNGPLLARLFPALTSWFVLSIILAPAVHSQVSDGIFTAPRAGLHVSGNRLVDGAGALVELHGVNISGTEFACAQGGTPGRAGWGISGGQPEDDPATISAIQSWHANAVRVPLNEDCWLGINGINPLYGGAAYRTAIEKFVRDLESARLYVIVDLHWSAPGSALALSQQPMADADHGPAFWASVATTFAADSNVVFDLYNEPFLYGSYMQNSSGDTWSCWLNGCHLNQYLTGGQPYTKRFAWQTAGMQQLIDVVRRTGATNVVIANGLDWANNDAGWLKNRPHDPTGNLAAGWHEYEGEACAALACWASNIAPIAQVVPVVTGETGDHAGKGCTLVNLPTFLPWADTHGISYLAWTFNPWGDTHDVLITDWKGTPSACEGRYYSAHLAALAQNPVAVQSSGPPALAGNTGGHTARADALGGGLRALEIAILAMGIVGFVLGVMLATNARRIAAITSMSRFADRPMMVFVRRHNLSVGLAIALFGAIVLCSDAILLG